MSLLGRLSLYEDDKENSPIHFSFFLLYSSWYLTRLSIPGRMIFICAVALARLLWSSFFDFKANIFSTGKYTVCICNNKVGDVSPKKLFCYKLCSTNSVTTSACLGGWRYPLFVNIFIRALTPFWAGRKAASVITLILEFSLIWIFCWQAVTNSNEFTKL